MPKLTLVAADGFVSSVCELDFVPRIGERMVINFPGEGPRPFRVKDVEYKLSDPIQTAVLLEDEPDATLLTD